MADETKIPVTPPQPGQPAQASQPAQPQQQQIQIPVDTSSRESVYINLFRPLTTTDDVFVDVGAYVPVVTPGGVAEPMVFTHRLIMNFVTAKKLAEALRAAVAQHEQMFGVVEVDPNRRLRMPPQQRPPMG
ncbi:MAG: DUF3467 domain-containing protein [Planctomycetia bacterium]|nr:DUF3467 domain-containing protein [Planctomycetia bacterium]